MQVINGGSTMRDSENQFDESMAIQVQSIECDSHRLKEQINYSYIKKKQLTNFAGEIFIYGFTEWRT
jgi:hypothetical protein